jgi:hypothetical protein
MHKKLFIFIFFGSFSFIASTPLDDYVWAPDENYAWSYMGNQYDFNGSIGSSNYTGNFIYSTADET